MMSSKTKKEIEARKKELRARFPNTPLPECKKCGWVWIPRVTVPSTCPNCKQDWQVPYNDPQKNGPESRAKFIKRQGKAKNKKASKKKRKMPSTTAPRKSSKK